MGVCGSNNIRTSSLTLHLALEFLSISKRGKKGTSIIICSGLSVFSPSQNYIVFFLPKRCVRKRDYYSFPLSVSIYFFAHQNSQGSKIGACPQKVYPCCQPLYCYYLGGKPELVLHQIRGISVVVGCKKLW